MVKLTDILNGKGIKASRERLGISQEALAERVRKLSGKKFSQQSLTKFKKGGSSAFAVYIICALDELEQETGVSFIRPSQGSVAIQESMSRLTDAELKEKILEFIPKLSPRDSIELALILLDQAKAQL